MKPGYPRIITSSSDDRRDLFVATARRVGTTEQNVEKDFWVCWTMAALFQERPAGAPRLLFKGGTSLSKAFGLIQRFSEDIDITVFHEDLGEPVSIDELETLSTKRRRAKLDAIRAACQRYLMEDLRPQLAVQVAAATRAAPGADVVIDDLDPDGQTILVRYPSVFAPDPYVRSVVRIEAGANGALGSKLDRTTGGRTRDCSWAPETASARPGCRHRQGPAERRAPVGIPIADQDRR